MHALQAYKSQNGEKVRALWLAPVYYVPGMSQQKPAQCGCMSPLRPKAASHFLGPHLAEARASESSRKAHLFYPRNHCVRSLGLVCCEIDQQPPNRTSHHQSQPIIATRATPFGIDDVPGAFRIHRLKSSLVYLRELKENNYGN